MAFLQALIRHELLFPPGDGITEKQKGKNSVSSGSQAKFMGKPYGRFFVSATKVDTACQGGRDIG